MKSLVSFSNNFKILDDCEQFSLTTCDDFVQNLNGEKEKLKYIAVNYAKSINEFPKLFLDF